MTVAILVPVLRRPHRVEQLVDSIEQATPEPHRTLFICSPDDEAEHDSVLEAGAEILIVTTAAGPGDYARKINRGVANTGEPFVFLGADDLRFRKHWLERAMEKLTDTVGVVGTNDLGNRHVLAGQHATHSLVARWYAALGTADGPELLHDGYDHNFVDNELVETAQARKAWAFAADSVVEHLHPSWGKSEWDEVYERGRSGWDADRRLFRSRCPLWRRLAA